MSEKIHTQTLAIIEEMKKYPEAAQALRRSAKTIASEKLYAGGMKMFSDFLHKTPTEIVAEYQADLKANQYEGFEKWEGIFADFDEWLLERHKGQGSIPFHAGALSLINQNVPRSLQLRAKVPDVYSKEIPPITKEDLKVIYLNMASPLQKALIAFLKDSGMSCADAARLKIGDLEGFDKGEQWVHLRVTREKEHVNYETFAGPNAVRDLKIYFDMRRRIGENLTTDSPLFASLNKNHVPYDKDNIGKTLHNLSRRSGKDISPHRLRKFFETQMATVVRHPVILKYWMGHKIKGRGRDIESRYVILPTPDQLKLYQDAYKNIDLSGGTLEDRVKAIEDFAKSLTPEQRAAAERSGIMFRERGKRRKSSTDVGQCDDGEHCGDFMEIDEGDLLAHLKQGFKIVHNLQNGRVIVER